MDHRPNVELTDDERIAKRELKRLLKLQHQRYKLETRIKQAAKRHDQDLVERTRRKLKAVALQEEQEGVLPQVASDVTTIEEDDDTAPRLQSAKRYVEAVYQQLQKSWSSDEQKLGAKDIGQDETCNNKSNNYHRETRRQRNRGNPQYTDPTTREQRIEEARILLQNMTKGTQSISMFNSTEALRGYTRHKFTERALLVASSFGKLQQLSLRQGTIAANHHPDAATIVASTARTMLQRLGKVRSLCSIGCGPGCDAVGVVAFLLQKSAINDKVAGADFSFDTEPQNRAAVLDRVVLLDWAIAQWAPILQPLRDLLVEQQHSVQRIDLATCDVRSSLFKQQHQQSICHQDVSREDEGDNGAGLTRYDYADVPTLISSSTSGEDSPSCSIDSSSLRKNDVSLHCLNIDLIVVSYLLSETRGQWQNLMDDIVQLSGPGTLFLFTDPTAWQMHIFRERYEFLGNSRSRQMDFLWLDSSMHRPELQVLEGRNGPAVLLAIKL